uniref:hypothetical protein n=1 Tax=Plantactinospora endophytica TaxID=673535 RepID=UPI00367315C3
LLFVSCSSSRKIKMKQNIDYFPLKTSVKIDNYSICFTTTNNTSNTIKISSLKYYSNLFVQLSSEEIELYRYKVKPIINTDKYIVLKPNQTISFTYEKKINEIYANIKNSQSYELKIKFMGKIYIDNEEVILPNEYILIQQIKL